MGPRSSAARTAVLGNTLYLWVKPQGTETLVQES